MGWEFMKLRTRASLLSWLPPQITQGRVRQAASQAADWLHHAATHEGVVLAGEVGTGSTADGVVRIRMRRTTITSRGDVRRVGAVLSRRTGQHGTAALLASHK